MTECSILAIDPHDETTCLVQVPRKICNWLSGLLNINDHLCIVTRDRYLPVITIYILKDLYQSEWIKVYKINRYINLDDIENFPYSPIAWQDDIKILFFRIKKQCSS